MRQLFKNKLIPRSVSTLLVALLSLPGGPVLAQDTPALTPHEAEYKVRISGISGLLTTGLTRDENGQYSATHSVRPTGLARLIAGGGRIEEQSVFAIDSGSLLATRYRSDDQLSRDKGTIELSFDADTQRLQGVVALEDGPDVTIDTELTEPLFDRVSVQYQLMLDLLSETDTTAIEATDSDSADRGAPDEYVIFDVDGNKTLQITRIGERSIRYRGDKLRALGVRHQSPGSSRKTELWLAPDLDYLPILIEQYRKDKLKLRATLRSYTALAESGGD